MPLPDNWGKTFDPLAASPQAAQEKSVFLPALARSAGGMVQDAGHLASALGAESIGTGMQAFGKGVEDANPAQFNGMAGLKASPWGFVKETMGELLPTAAGMVIPGGIIGKGLMKVAPAVFGEGTAAQLLAPKVIPGLSRGLQVTGPGAAMGLGMGAGSTVMETGGILSDQMDETGQYNLGRAALFGLGAGSLDASMGIGGVIGKGLAGQLGHSAIEKVGLRQIGKQALKTGAEEGLQEGVQTGLEMEGTKEGGFNQKIATAQGVDDLLTSIVKGFIGGGAFGGVHGGKQYLERKSVESEVKAQLAESQKQENEEKAKAAAQQQTQDTATRGAEQVAAQTQGVPGQMGDLFPETVQAGPLPEQAAPETEISTTDTQTRDWVAEQSLTQEAARRARMQALAQSVADTNLPPPEAPFDQVADAEANLQRMRARQEAAPGTQGMAVEEIPIEDTITAQPAIPAHVGNFLKLTAAQYVGANQEQKKKILRARIQVRRVLSQQGVPEESLPSVEPTAQEMAGAVEEIAIKSPEKMAQEKIPTYAVTEVAAAPVPKSAKQVNPVPVQKVQPNEKAPAADQSVDATPAAETPARAGPTDAGKTRTEVKSAPASEAARNGSSTNEDVTTNGLQTQETRNAPAAETQVGGKDAVQVGSAKTAPVGQGTEAGKGVGTQVPNAKESAAKARNAETEEVVGEFPAALKLSGEKALQYAKWGAKLKATKSLARAKDTADGVTRAEKISDGTATLEAIGRLLSGKTKSDTHVPGIGPYNSDLFALANEARNKKSEGGRAGVRDVAKQALDYLRVEHATEVQRAEKAADKAIQNTKEVLDQQDKEAVAEEVKAKTSGPMVGEEEHKPGKATITIYDSAGVEHTFDNKQDVAKFKKDQKKLTPEQAANNLVGEKVTDAPEAVRPNADKMQKALFPGREFDNTTEDFAAETYDGRKFEYRSSHPMPNQKVYDKAVKAGDLAGIQTLIRSHFKTNKAMQRILDWVESSVGDVKIVHVNEDMTDDYGHYVGAEYDPATHTTTVYQGGSNPVVLAHELVHAAMERQLQEVASYKGPKTEAMQRKVKAYNELKAQYEKFKTAMPNSEAYGLTNLSEFMAEVFSNVDFRAALQTQPKTSFFRGLMRSIANFLGFKTAEKSALEDIFSAAQVLAYRNPGEVFTPTAWKTVYSVADTMPSITKYVNETYDNNTKLGIWGERGKGVLSQAKAKLQNALFGLSTGHNIDEMFGWIPGVRDIFTTQNAQEAFATKLQDRVSIGAEGLLKFKKQAKEASDHMWTGLTQSSIFRLSMDEVEKVATGKENYDSLLEKQNNLPKNQKLEGTNLQGTAEDRKQFDSMVSHLRAIGWGKKPTRTETANKPENVLPSDNSKWTPQEWGEWIVRENRKTAQNLYESSLLNVVARLYKGNDQALEKLYKPSTTFPMIEKMYVEADNKTSRDADYVSNIKRMRDQAMSHVYIHVHRKGDYFVTLSKPKESASESDQVKDFVRFESEYEAKQAAEAMRNNQQVKDAGLVVSSGQISDFTRQSAVGGMMQLADQMTAHLEAMKEVSGMDQKHIDLTKDIIRQTMYDLMPESNIMKSYLHRKGTPGWKPEEQFQGFVQHLIQSNFHYANNRFLGKYELGFAKIKEAIKDMEEPHRLDGMKQLDAKGTLPQDQKDYLSKIAHGNPHIAKKLLNELLLRHTGNFVTMETPIADRWRSATYAWQLGLAPGYLLANLAQPIQLGMPTLGGRYGWKNSTKALMDGYKVAADVMGVMTADGGMWKARTTEDVTKALEGKFDGQTLLALRHMLDSGKVTYTLAKEAGMLAEGQSLNGIFASRVVSSAAHYSEMLNRVAVGMAAYGLETARSNSQEKAEAAAIWAIDETQFDYNKMNQSRFLGRNSPLGRYTPLLSVFMSYNVQMMELYARHMRTAIMTSDMSWLKSDWGPKFAGTEAEMLVARKEAWNTLAGMFATTFTLAGAMGLPFSSLIYALAGQMGGDDDDPLDVPLAMRAWATTAFGSDGGLAATEGLPAVFGVNMSQRLGQNDIVPYSRFLTDHRTLSEMPAEVLAKNISAPIATLLSWSTGLSKAYDYMMDGASGGGDAMIKALPAALRGVGTAMYGYHDVAGQELPHEVTAWQTAMQMLGIAPQFRNDQMMLLMADKSKEAMLAKRAAYIRSNLAYYTKEGDQEMVDRFREKSQVFIEANPSFASRMSIAPLLKKMDSNRAFYQMTGMGSVVPKKRLEEVYGLAQMLDLPEKEE